jgi:hypothetical protein
MQPIRPLISYSLAALAALGLSLTAHAQSPIKIGVLAPVTGPLATPGKDMVEGWKMFWDQAGHTAGGRNAAAKAKAAKNRLTRPAPLPPRLRAGGDPK